MFRLGVSCLFACGVAVCQQMPIENHYGGWRACLSKSRQRVRGPVRATRDETAGNLTHLQEAGQESLAALHEEQKPVLPRLRCTVVEARALSQPFSCHFSFASFSNSGAPAGKPSCFLWAVGLRESLGL